MWTERAELRLNIRQTNRRARLAACRNNRVLHEAAKGITAPDPAQAPKGNDLITRKRTTHRNRGIHRQLIKTIRTQNAAIRADTRSPWRANSSPRSNSAPAWRISAPGAGGLKTLRHIQVMNARLSFQMGTHARTRRTLRTLHTGANAPHAQSPQHLRD